MRRDKEKKAVAAIKLSLFVVIILGIGWRMFLYESPRIKFVREMGEGINIGNALDSNRLSKHSSYTSELDYEISWGNPFIEKELFIMIKDAGFSTVRIPVTWQEHMNESGEVNDVWMDRVQEVVDMALGQDLYVVLDTHHEKWLDLQVEKEVEITNQYRKLWAQIATRFASYDSKLLFEGMNEPRLRDSEYEWTEGTEELRKMVNRLNQVFVETVRAIGEENEERYLLICPYANRSEKDAMKELEVPRGNIIVSIHMYSPYSFCQNEDGVRKWDVHSDEGKEDAQEIKDKFEDIEKIYIRKGIPVIITEFGCKDKDNLEDRIKWIRFYREQAKRHGIPCVWWDNGSSYQIMDRENNSWKYPQIRDELVK